MNESIAQEFKYGCGVACFTFVCGITFQEAVALLGREYGVKHEWRPSDLVTVLKQYGLNYKNKYVRKMSDHRYPENTIILIERSAAYPVGHYLVSQKVSGWIRGLTCLATEILKMLNPVLGLHCPANLFTH